MSDDQQFLDGVVDDGEHGYTYPDPSPPLQSPGVQESLRMATAEALALIVHLEGKVSVLSEDLDKSVEGALQLVQVLRVKFELERDSDAELIKSLKETVKLTNAELARNASEMAMLRANQRRRWFQ